MFKVLKKFSQKYLEKLTFTYSVLPATKNVEENVGLGNKNYSTKHTLAIHLTSKLHQKNTEDLMLDQN